VQRTRGARLFPNEAACPPLASAIPMKSSEDWQSADKRYVVFSQYAPYRTIESRERKSLDPSTRISKHFGRELYEQNAGDGQLKAKRDQIECFLQRANEVQEDRGQHEIRTE
jgi:hypothetical protein